MLKKKIDADLSGEQKTENRRERIRDKLQHPLFSVVCRIEYLRVPK